MTPQPQHCAHFWFSGHVQGVGFRYATHQIARHYELAGYVRNLPDGQVELLLEGDPAEIERCREEVMRRLGPHIREVREDRRAASGGFPGFEIRY